MEKYIEQAVTAGARAAEAGLDSGQTGSSASMEKFKSRESLERAYAQLERAFTKKCQELSRLKEGTSAPADPGSAPPSAQKQQPAQPCGDTEEGGPLSADELHSLLLPVVLSDERLRAEVIRTYLLSLKQGAPPAGICGSRPALTPPPRPSSIEEAGKYALYLLKK